MRDKFRAAGVVVGGMSGLLLFYGLFASSGLPGASVVNLDKMNSKTNATIAGIGGVAIGLFLGLSQQ